MDNNGYNETSILSFHEVSPGGDSSFGGYISVGSTFAINKFIESDVIHRCFNNINDSTYNYIYYNELSIFNCDDPGIDTIYDESWGQYHYPVIHQYGEKISNNMEWDNGFHILAFRDSSNYKTSNDGIIYIESWDIIRGYWNNLEEKYVLIKKYKAGKDYYGWFKLSIQNYNEILLHEYAIEKY